ncbi:MAG: CoA transferase [Azospirillaceae bacterium]
MAGGGADPTLGPPLQGVRVLDFTENLPGPFAGMILAQLGATVVKIERPGGDPMRGRRPGGFAAINQGKRSLTIDLKDPAGQKRALRIAAQADVLMQSFRPGVMARLGLGYDRVREENPGIIYLSMSSYGSSGPLSTRAGHDQDVAALAGLVSLCGRPGSDPSYHVGIPTSDNATTLYAVIAILGALLQRRQPSRGGQHLDLAMADALLAAMTPRFGDLHDRPELDRRDFVRPGSGVYRCDDGTYLAVAAVEQHYWTRLMKALVLTEIEDLWSAGWQERMGAFERIDRALDGRFRQESRSYWLKLLDDAGIPASPVQTLPEVVRHEHFLARGSFADQPFISPRFPVRLEGISDIAETARPSGSSLTGKEEAW